jgi:hypothetical protein
LSIAPHEPLLALEPSPPGLDHGTRPGIPEAAGATRGPGPEDVEHLHKLKRGDWRGPHSTAPLQGRNGAPSDEFTKR